MTVIELNRKTNTLRVGETLEDIKHLTNVSFFYDIAYVLGSTPPNGWYVLYNTERMIAGFVTDVEYVKEKWV